MEIQITKFDHFGRGIGKINNKVVFVNKALPKEIVDISITKEKKNYYEGDINKIILESPFRVQPICPFYDKCGGCDFLHTTYEEEKNFKLAKGKELLGNVYTIYETKKLNYRNKVVLHVKEGKIGFYKKGSNDIIPINYCYLLNDNINKVIKDLQIFDLSKYNINQITIKCSQDKILLVIDNLVDNNFIDYFNYINTIICGNKIVKGNGYIEEIIDDKIFKITKEAFFQVNKEGLINIYSIIKKFLLNKKINQALDLYSGTSLWGILISKYVNNVASIEINKEACLSAKDNIKNNCIKNIRVINGDVSDYIDKFNNIHLVIIDPPRSGLDKKTVDYLLQIKSKYIIYISCDMMSLRRDLRVLDQLYKTAGTVLVDMFRGTYHVETVCLLSRKTLDK